MPILGEFVKGITKCGRADLALFTQQSYGHRLLSNGKGFYDTLLNGDDRLIDSEILVFIEDAQSRCAIVLAQSQGDGLARWSGAVLDGQRQGLSLSPQIEVGIPPAVQIG